jgi:hypothetical protein
MRTLTINLLLLLTITLFANCLHAQTSLSCDGKFYVSHANSISGNDSTYIDNITFNHGSTFQTSFSVLDTIGLNALGFNPVDGYIYGLRYPSPISEPELIRVDATGTFFDLGQITGDYPAGSNPWSGCFDVSGNYYISNDPGNGNISNLYKVNVSTNVSTIVGSTNLTPQSGGDIFFVDFAFDPQAGKLYGVSSYCCGEGGTNSSALYQMDTTTGNATFINQLNPIGSYFGMFFNNYGQLFVYKTDGTLYQVDLTTGNATLVGSGISYTFADACSCTFRVSNQLSANAYCNSGVAHVDLQAVLSNFSSAAQSGLTYSLTLPKVFHFSQTEAALEAILNPLYGGTVNVTISSANGGTNNQINITGLNIAVNNSIVQSTSFTLNTIVDMTAPTLTYNIASSLSGLPLSLGTIEPSDDPSTLDADDSTTVNLPAGCVVLAVKLISFDVSRQDNTSLITWSTASEINSDYFEIEKSADGENWTSLGKVAASGNSNLQRQYSFIDQSPFVGNNYYRLKQVNTDGSYLYGPVKLLKFDNSISNVLVYPNPSKNFFELYTNSTETAPYDISDVTGKLIQKGLITNSIKINGLASGVYVARVYAQAGTKIVKIVVQ